MKAERSNDIDSIPDGGISGKDIVSDALKGSPVRVGECWLQVSHEATGTDLVSICQKLFNTSTSLNVVLFFCMGDTYNYTPAYSQERRTLEAGIEKRLGLRYAVRLREFARIARRWPAHRRTTERCWQYYKDFKPGLRGKPDIPAGKKQIALQEVSSIVENGEEVITMENASKQQQYICRRKPKQKPE